MENNIDQSQTQTTTNKNGFISRAWSGEIKLWQAIVLVNIIGFVIMQILSISGGTLLFELTHAKIYNIIFMLLINIIYGVFAVTCLWRTAPNPKTSIKGTLTKIWAVVFAAYLINANYGFIFN